LQVYPCIFLAQNVLSWISTFESHVPPTVDEAVLSTTAVDEAVLSTTAVDEAVLSTTVSDVLGSDVLVVSLPVLGDSVVIKVKGSKESVLLPKPTSSPLPPEPMHLTTGLPYSFQPEIL